MQFLISLFRTYVLYCFFIPLYSYFFMSALGSFVRSFGRAFFLDFSMYYSFVSLNLCMCICLYFGIYIVLSVLVRCIAPSFVR